MLLTSVQQLKEVGVSFGYDKPELREFIKEQQKLKRKKETKKETKRREP